MKKTTLSIFFLLLFSFSYGQKYNIRGKIINTKNRETISYIVVKVLNSGNGTVSTSDGSFIISNLNGGSVRLEASGIGYKTVVTPEIMIGGKDSYIEIEMEENTIALNEVNVVAGPYRKTIESPVALRVIGFTEIERSAGSGRDISRVIQSFPGVASSPSGYRNDLIVRGGGPSENRFFIDGVEVPNINHFSTQGASGGPTGLINADLISEVNFFSGAFPSNRGNALSSVLEFKLKDGSMDNNRFSAVLGTSDIGFSAEGHLGSKTTYIASVRQSYLQFLFKALNLPFLPTFTDLQFKVKHRFNAKNELIVLGLAGIDDMKLNTDTVGQTDINKYTLSTLPIIKQQTYTVGAKYTHYGSASRQTIVLSHNYLRNINYKHANNDVNERRILDLNSREQEFKFRFENDMRLGVFQTNSGISLESGRLNNTLQTEFFFNGQTRPFASTATLDVFKYGLFGSIKYESSNSKFTSALGVRMDGASFNQQMSNPLNQLSGRLSLSYQLNRTLFLNGSTGLYYELPSYLSMAYSDNSGLVNNKNLRYQRALHGILGIEHRPTSYAQISLEGFYKHYSQMPFSLLDSVPLASKGADYGTVGFEPLSSTAKGRAYGIELLARWYGYKNINLIAAYTWVRSEYSSTNSNTYLPTRWDNRHLLTVTGGYKFPRNWELGLKYRVVGPAPYTPFDKDKSSLIAAWDVYGKPYLDYSRYNSERLPWFNQLDLRVDKLFFFRKQMLNIFLDLQNALNFKYKDAPALINTGQIDPSDPTRYILKEIPREIGTIVPSIGVAYKF